MKKITVQEASEQLGVTVQTIYRYIKKHKMLKRVKTLKEKKLVVSFNDKEFQFLQSLTAVNETFNTPVKDDVNEILKTTINKQEEQLTYLQKTINTLLIEKSEKDKRSDTIIMTLTQQIQNQSMQLEDLRTKKEETPKPKTINKTLKKEIEEQDPESKPTFKQKIVYFFKPHLQRKRV